MSSYAQVIIDISLKDLDRPFTYRIPENLKNSLTVGSLVFVPFGRGNVKRKGYCVGFTDTCTVPAENIKDILEVATKGREDTGERALILAQWMKCQYGSTLSQSLKVVLTKRVSAKPIETKTVCLLLSQEEAKEKLLFYEAKHQTARARLLSALIDYPQQPASFLFQNLHITPAVLSALEKQGILKVETSSSLRNPVALSGVEDKKLTLSEEQQSIVDGVLEDFEALQNQETDILPRVSLIYGITGSGKTEVYITIIEKIVKQGRQAIMLIPEISLTYQTLIRFYRHFGERVSVMNSTLSEGEKSDQFERARRGEIDVIIGPRSALFTPFPHIGVIVIDEEHEASYKNEFMPKYHAREVAQKIAQMHGAVLVLGSATPSMESYERACRGEYRLYTLQRRLTGATLPDVEIRDMRKEIANGNHSLFSNRLESLIEDRLEKKEQVMLFLNRRGFSGFVLCRSCGYVPKCPHCSVSLSLHGSRRLICHYCGYEEEQTSDCPSCGSSHFTGMNAGTQKVEVLLEKMYPKARILRMDADTTREKGSYEKILTAFSNEEADILIGTQMIVKGHDFPKVTLVGILMADLSLHMSDYRAAERTFQLLTQAAGRAGRGRRAGNVIIQTYEPNNYSIAHAARQDYEGFYQEEIRYRRFLDYPPASHMLAIQITSPNEDHAQLFAGQTRELLTTLLTRRGDQNAVIVVGPAAASMEKLRDEYRYVLYVKSSNYDKLIYCKDQVEIALQRAKKAAGELDTVFLFDFDPMNPF